MIFFNEKNVDVFGCTTAGEIEKQKRIIEDAKNKVIENLIELDKQKNLVEQKNKELNKVLTNLQDAQQQLVHSEKMASLGELTVGIAHEIQNSLNFVNNFSDVNSKLVDELKTELAMGNMQQAALAEDIKDNEGKIISRQTCGGDRKEYAAAFQGQHGPKGPTPINALKDEYVRLAYHGQRAKGNTFNATIKMGIPMS